ncbi:MAG: DNA-processing protein DprA [Bacteroidota bacterium]
MSEELLFQVALDLIPGVGDKGSKQLISYCGSASAVFKAPKNKLLKIPGVGEKAATIISKTKPFQEAEKILRTTEELGAKIIHFTNKEYPQRLKEIQDAPNLLFTKGNALLNPRKSLAVVGTRNATPYGKQLTETIIEELVDQEITIVSGLAYGIDIHAHKACLKYQIPTFAVIAGGLDRIYPGIHKKYAYQIMEEGAVLSESVPGTKPDAPLFPARNRIIAGMTDATLVIEAAEKGGALITAHLADSYNRLVFALPGNVNNKYSQGTNHLIATQRALIYRGIGDLLYNLKWDEQLSSSSAKEDLPELSYEENLVFDLLRNSNEPIEIDQIAILLTLPINQVASILLTLEFKNLVKSLPGKKYTNL